ncbi:hypothetical protein K9823_003359 [Vibrio cholerae]|nr:hypothetical protein [Vibrio cholerae]EJL6912616.1 hypothetical protein [Vibrio cholerae]
MSESIELAGQSVQCGNAISEVLNSLLNFFLGIYQANAYLGSIVIIAVICLPFYVVYCLKNNNVASALSAIFSKGGS